LVVDPHPPLLHRQLLLCSLARARSRPHGPRPALDKGPGVRWILEDRQNRRARWHAPAYLVKALAAREPQVLRIQELEDLAGRPALSEGGKAQLEPVLDFAIGLLVDRAVRRAP